MAKRTKTYILLIVVLAIWGIIGYKVFSTLNPNDGKKVNPAFSAQQFKPKNKKPDTFSIQPMDRDPFLGKIKTKKPQKTYRHKTQTEKVNWPVITYQGIVKNMNSKKEKVFVVNINNKQYLLKKGQTRQKVTLLQGNDKEIKMRYSHSLKTFTVQ